MLKAKEVVGHNPKRAIYELAFVSPVFIKAADKK